MHVNLDTGERPKLAWVEISKIRVDDNYQRQVKGGRVAQILRDFNWAHFGAVMLAEHEDGTYTVYDGQHRVEACRQHPQITEVPAMIVTFDESYAEAGAFLGVNVNRSAITTVERYHAGIEAGDKQMMAVCAVLEEAGCEVVAAGKHSPAPNRTAAVAAIARTIKLYGDGATVLAIQTLRKAWPKDSKALNGVLIQSLARLYKSNRKTMLVERMAEKLRGKDRAILTAEAEMMRKIGGSDATTSVTKTLVETYNRGLQSNQISIGVK
jgi:hypothetical protein